MFLLDFIEFNAIVCGTKKKRGFVMYQMLKKYFAPVVSNSFKEYITPVMQNMDENTKNHLMYRFYCIYGLNPKNMLSMVSQPIKESRIHAFYFCVSQLYNCNVPDIHIIAKSGQEEKFQQLLSRTNQMPLPEINSMRNNLIELAKYSTISTKFTSKPIPKRKIEPWSKHFNRGRQY